MEKNLNGLMAKAVSLLSERMDAIEARQVASDFLITALMRATPDLDRVLDQLEEALSVDIPGSTDSQQKIGASGQARARKLLDAYRRTRVPTE